MFQLRFYVNIIHLPQQINQLRVYTLCLVYNFHFQYLYSLASNFIKHPKILVLQYSNLQWVKVQTQVDHQLQTQVDRRQQLLQWHSMLVKD